MVSLDDVAKNREFAESLAADVVLLSDATGLTARAYGVVDAARPVPRRWTFTIDPDGVIVHIDRDVAPAEAGRRIVATLEALGFERRGDAPVPPVPAP
jgi:peroxiredoxin